MTLETKDDALTALEKARAVWIEAARDWASLYCLEHGEVTVEDLRRDGPPLPEGADPRAYGAVWRRDFELVKYRTGRRKMSHNRPIGIFKMKGEV